MRLFFPNLLDVEVAVGELVSKDAKRIRRSNTATEEICRTREEKKITRTGSYICHQRSKQ